MRGIAAWFVVFYHIRASIAPGVPEWTTALFAKGYLAVDLFFVLSGFVLWLTWGAKFAEHGWVAAPAFLRKRVARVWPLHAFVLAATVGFALVIAASGRPIPEHYKWSELPLHLLLIQNWGFTRELAWNDPSWSISTEMAAYLLFAIVAPLLRRGNAAIAVPTALVLIVGLDRLFAANGSDLLGHDIPHLGLARCLAQFGCGVAMCIMWQRWQDTKMVVATGTIAGLATTLWLCGVLRETFAVPLAFAALVPMLASTSVWAHNPLSSRLALKLGEISYSTYLAHFLLWAGFKIALVTDPANVPLGTAALYMLVTLAASFALYRFVELPARNLLSGNHGAA